MIGSGSVAMAPRSHIRIPRGEAPAGAAPGRSGRLTTERDREGGGWRSIAEPDTVGRSARPTSDHPCACHSDAARPRHGSAGADRRRLRPPRQQRGRVDRRRGGPAHGRDRAQRHPPAAGHRPRRPARPGAQPAARPPARRRGGLGADRRPHRRGHHRGHRRAERGAGIRQRVPLRSCGRGAARRHPLRGSGPAGRNGREGRRDDPRAGRRHRAPRRRRGAGRPSARSRPTGSSATRRCSPASRSPRRSRRRRTPPSDSAVDLPSCAFMGTIVHQGSGEGVVVATGMATAFGKIAVGLGERPPRPPSRSGCGASRRLLVKVAGVLTVGIFAINVALDRPLIEALLFSLAIAIGITPQLLPAIVSVSLSSGSRALARKRVLVKRLVTIEDLGNIDVLFTDKTGNADRGRDHLPGGPRRLRARPSAAASPSRPGLQRGGHDADGPGRRQRARRRRCTAPRRRRRLLRGPRRAAGLRAARGAALRPRAPARDRRSARRGRTPRCS